MTILGKILAEEIHDTPGKILAGDDRDATARPLPGPRQDPCLARVCRDSTTNSIQLPAQPVGQAPAWQRAASRPTQQAPAWWHADIHEDPTTMPSQQPASLLFVALHALLDWTRVGARRGGDGRDGPRCHPQ